MPPSDKASRVVFIGNIPYDIPEEQIIDIFSSVGQVVHFRLVHDKESGRPKGFGFMEFSDADAAASAVRNLNDHEINNRRLRVDWSNDGATNDSNSNTNTQHHQQQQQQQYQSQPQPPQANAPPPVPQNQGGNLPPLPQGAELPPNVTCPDAISRTLKTVPPPQLLDVISQMKGLVHSDPGKATELLTQAPQLAYAIFQALLLLGLVDTSILASVVSTAQNQPQTQPMPQQSFIQPLPPPQFQPPQMNTMTPPKQNQFRAPPPQPMAGVPNKDMLKQQVLSLSPQAIEAMEPETRNQVLMLRQRIMAGQM